MIQIGVDISRDEQIQMSIAIIVSPRCARAEPSAGDSGLLGYVFKLAVSQVVIEHVAAVPGYINIGQAIVVVVRHGNSHAPSFVSEPASLVISVNFRFSPW